MTGLSLNGRRLAAAHRALGGPRLDWTPHPHPGNRLYGVADVVDTTADLVPVVWRPPAEPLHQGSEGACMGAAAAHLVGTDGPGGVRGLQPPLTMAAASEWYRIGQVLDQVPGNSYVGTTTLGIAKAGQERGYWSGYRWAFGADQLAAALPDVGPAVVGIPWHSGMYRLPDDPRSSLPPILSVSGPKVGGHALLVYALVTAMGLGWHFLVLNSWGPAWGRRGGALVHLDTMRALLADGGEAMLPTGRPATAPPWQLTA